MKDFPAGFAESVAGVSGEAEARRLLESLNGEAITSVRYNPLKMSALPTGSDTVLWNRYGAYLPVRPVFTLDPAMHGGAYYVQEASSQFVEHLYRQALAGSSEARGDGADVGSGARGDGGGALPEGVRLLDLCAAPGGKATLYSTLAGPSGLVVANEVVRSRASVLADNVRRWGVGNVAVSSNDPADFGAWGHWFDVLAIDAPCSGEGMFRKNLGARSEWSPAVVEMNAARACRIVADSWDALRPGGVVIYSTCTFNRHENEENIAWMVENFDIEPVDVTVPNDWGIERGEVSGVATFRFWPHKVRGEGFFAAVMRKADGRVKRRFPRTRREPLSELGRAESRALGSWVGSPQGMRFARAGENIYALYNPQYEAVASLAGGLNMIYSGVCMGGLFGGKLRPDHALALFHDLGGSNPAAVTPVTLNEALDYLRRRPFGEVSRLAEGLNLLTFEGLPVGWTKRVGWRDNTLLPSAFRIANL